jgi:tripartite-type tricarboxylate transporter receptor subunit TctC
MRMTLTAVALAAAALGMTAHGAERYPNRPVRFIVPYPPGGGSDITGRAIGERLSASTGQTFVIDSRPGATGLIGTEIAARSPGDGYTIILADAPHTINAVVYKRRRYDAMKERFAQLAFDAAPGTPEQFVELLKSEDTRWRAVAKEVTVSLD